MRNAEKFITLALGTLLIASPAMAGEKAVAGAAQESTDPMEKIVCKSSLETGSLVRRTKRCFTRREWNRIADAARTGGQALQENGTGRPPGE